jgi:putative membrane protein
MLGHDQMMWGFGGWGMTFFWILVIIGIVFLIKWLVEQGRPSKKEPEGGESALDILKKRYARGEIEKEEFEQKKKDLMGSLQGFGIYKKSQERTESEGS